MTKKINNVMLKLFNKSSKIEINRLIEEGQDDPDCNETMSVKHCNNRLLYKTVSRMTR